MKTMKKPMPAGAVERDAELEATAVPEQKPSRERRPLADKTDPYPTLRRRSLFRVRGEGERD